MKATGPCLLDKVRFSHLLHTAGVRDDVVAWRDGESPEGVHHFGLSRDLAEVGSVVAEDHVNDRAGHEHEHG
jgi:hypothetical protein